jgi:TolB-like protein/Tfp pilus assembly protein PilF
MNEGTLRFEDFDVDLRGREIRKGTSCVRLQEQPFQLLTMMLERPGSVVTRDEIRVRLWPDGTTVDFEHSVNAAIKRLRAALGDAAEHPRYVETLHRRGYRFIGALKHDRQPRDEGSVRSPMPPRRPRLVVLPFANLSGDPAQEYISDGMTEEMIAQLGRRCANRIGVLARTSSMLYKNATRGAADIGEALHADYLVEGSVRRDGDRVRITAQLIETAGETHLWAESYDRQLADCLAVQIEVAGEIAHALTHELFTPVREAGGAATARPAAYQAYLKGRFYWNKPGYEGLRESIAFYDQALALDPAFSRAHSSRARAFMSLADYYLLEPRLALQAARAAAQRALALDAADSEAHLALAEACRILDWDWKGADDGYRRALTLHENNEAAYRYYAVFLAARRSGAEARIAADRACELDPLCLTVSTSAATVQYFGGDYEAALARCRYVLDMDGRFPPARQIAAASLVQMGRYDEGVAELSELPGAPLDPVSLAWMGHALAAGGHRDQARSILGRLDRLQATVMVPPYHAAVLLTGLGDIEGALARLERACDLRDPWFGAIAVDPRLTPLRDASRFTALTSRIGLR